MSSLKKLLKSPSRTFPKSKPKRSKSVFSRFFSKKKSDKYDDESSVSFHHKDVEHGEEEFESMKENTSSYIKEDANTKTSADEEKKHDLIQVTQEVLITNEHLYNEIKEGMAKVHEGLDKVVHASEFAATTGEKSLDVRQLSQHENNALAIVEQLQEVATNDPSSIEQVTIEVEDSLEKIEPFLVKNEKIFNDEDIKEEKKTEDTSEKIEPFLVKNEEIFNDEDIKEEKKAEDFPVKNEKIFNDEDIKEEKKAEDTLEKIEPFPVENEKIFNDEDIKEGKTTEDNLEKIKHFPVRNEEIFNDEDIKEEKKTEDNCVLSLAQGLGKICTVWSTNK